ncbi:hypothetical protein GCM10009665_33280 [Kitasatospora nipponensis]|uniref:Chromosome partitioning protein n=1 Tax=Kitasatospora nipponensis TaxID=258049 RepID=A0ABP4GVC5_9ACTN
MVPGVEIVVGYVFAWAVRKAGRIAGRLDGEVDRAVDAGMDRLHEVVGAKLGQDPALGMVVEEATAGREELTERTHRRLTDSLEEATERDPGFAEALAEIVAHLQSLQADRDADTADGAGDRINFSHGTFNGPVQGKGVQHIHYGTKPQ